MIADCEEDLPDLVDECLLCGEPTLDELHAHCPECIAEGHPCCDATKDLFAQEDE